MINFDDVTKENIKEHNPNWPQIPDRPSFNLINHQPDIEKIYLYAKYPYEEKYQFLINKRESTGSKHFNDSKAYDINIYKNIEEYNPKKKRKILIVFDDMTSDMFSDKKLNSIVTELFIRGRKLNISCVFITKSYFPVPKHVRVNSTHYFIMKIPNKQEHQQIAFNHSSEIDFRDLF